MKPSWIAELAVVSYCSTEVFWGWAESIGATRPTWRKEGDDVVVSLLYEGRRYVAFRGSDSKVDWLTNIVRCRKDGIHAGFLATYNNLLEHIPDGDVWVGHSRGAGLATIAGLKNGGEVWTFGSPRVLDSKRAAEFNRNVRQSVRYAFWGDPVTHFPLIGYKHVKGKRSFNGINHDIRLYLEAVRP